MFHDSEQEHKKILRFEREKEREREMRGIDETKCVSRYDWMKVVTPFPNWEEFDSEREHNMTEHTVTYLVSSRDDVVIREVGGFCAKCFM